MFHNFTFLINSIPYLFAAWVIAVIVHYARTKKLKFWKFSFCIKNYYWLLAGLLASQIVYSIQTGSFKSLIFLIFFAATGVMGEILFSEWWRTIYKKKLYVYRIETIDHAYSSFLNFLPYGLLGGFLFLNIVNTLTKSPPQSTAGSGENVPFYIIFALAFLIGFLIQWTVFHASGMKKFEQTTLANYLFFVSPFLLALAVCSLAYTPNFIGIAVAFGIIGSFVEYVFGKATEFFISKKLWAYYPLAIDKGHFTPLSLIPFSMMGFYFWGIGLFLESLLR